MNQRLTKTVIAAVLAWVAGFITSLVNHLSLGDALLRSLGFAILVAAIVAVLAWASEKARQKGYPGWLGFWLVLILNVIGVILVWLLPDLNRNSA